MVRGPPKQKTHEIGPGEGVELAPVLLHQLGWDLRTVSCQVAAESFEVEVEIDVGMLLAPSFVETTAEQVGEVFYADSSPHILKVQGSYWAVGAREAKVSSFGVAMDQCLIRTLVQVLIDARGRRLEPQISHHLELLWPCS